MCKIDGLLCPGLTTHVLKDIIRKTIIISFLQENLSTGKDCVWPTMRGLKHGKFIIPVMNSSEVTLNHMNTQNEDRKRKNDYCTAILRYSYCILLRLETSTRTSQAFSWVLVIRA